MDVRNNEGLDVVPRSGSEFQEAITTSDSTLPASDHTPAVAFVTSLYICQQINSMKALLILCAMSLSLNAFAQMTAEESKMYTYCKKGIKQQLETGLDVTKEGYELWMLPPYEKGDASAVFMLAIKQGTWELKAISCAYGKKNVPMESANFICIPGQDASQAFRDACLTDLQSVTDQSMRDLLLAGSMQSISETYKIYYTVLKNGDPRSLYRMKK